MVLVPLTAVPAIAGGTTAANFLKLPHGTRATAMGSEFTAFAEGAEAVYWNPAGLANGEFNEGRAVFNKWIEGTYYGHASYRHSLESGGFGAAVTYFSSGELTRRVGPVAEGTYRFQTAAIDAAQGVRISESVNLGVSLRFIYEEVDGESANALAGGLGGQYNKRIDDNHHLWVGISAANLGTKMGYDEKYDLPAAVRLGVGDIMHDGRFRASAGVSYYIYDKVYSGGVGAEYSLTPAFDLRAGYRFGGDIPTLYGFTAGIGIRHIDDIEYIVDISAGFMGDLGLVLMAGTGVAF